MSKPQIVVCGSIAIDRIMNFSGRYRDLIKPEKLHVISLSVTIDKLEDSRGGCGANICYSLAMLGEQPVILGSVGQDAKDYMKDLEGLGIDTSNIHFSQLPTSSYNGFTDAEDNQVGGFYQGAMSESDSVSFGAWQNKDVLAVVAPGNSKHMNRLVNECQRFNLRMVYDPGQQLSEPALDPAGGVAAAEIVLANDYELDMLSRRVGKTPEELKQQVPIMITTLGGEGSVIEGSKVGEPIKIGIAKADVVDPTGAGDAYRAGFLYGYLRKWDLRTCGQLGATVASFIIEKHGTQQPFSKQAVIDRYRESFNEEIEL